MVIRRIHTIYLGVSTALIILFSASGEFSFAHFNGTMNKSLIITILSILVAALLILTMFRKDRPDIQYRMTTVILVLLVFICILMVSLGMRTLIQPWINLSPLSGILLVIMSRRRINQDFLSNKQNAPTP